MKSTSFNIRKISDSSQLTSFVGKGANEWGISLYFFSKSWAMLERRKWRRRLRSSLEDALVSFQTQSGSPHPAITEILSLDWLTDLDFAEPGTFVAFIDQHKLSWLLNPFLSINRTVVARSFHVKPLLSHEDRENPFPTELVQSFNRLKARGLATDHLPTAAKWIAEGRVTALFASANRQVWGQLNHSNGDVRTQPKSLGRGCDDLLDDLLETAWTHGASCWVVEDHQLPSSSPIVVFQAGGLSRAA
jgi:hypothetical protein